MVVARGRGTLPVAVANRVITTVAASGDILDLDPGLREWLPVTGPRDRLRPGATTGRDIRIPQRVADQLLKGFVRFVADIPAGTDLTVVWERGADELQVDCGSITLTCTPGVLTVTIAVSCDQLPRPVRVGVPFGVGRVEHPRGLLMSSYTRVDAPAVVADGWSDAIVAFCWEALLETARRVAAGAGKDRSGTPLVPAAIAAEDGLFVVLPMARHDLSGLVQERGNV